MHQVTLLGKGLDNFWAQGGMKTKEKKDSVKDPKKELLLPHNVTRVILLQKTDSIFMNPILRWRMTLCMMPFN